MKIYPLALFTVVGLTVTAFGQDPVPSVDPLAALVSLIASWSSLTALAKGSALIVLLTAILTKFVAPDLKWKRLTVAVLSTAYAVVMAVSGGMGLIEALVLALVTGGGAIAIYEAGKGLAQAAKTVAGK